MNKIGGNRIAAANRASCWSGSARVSRLIEIGFSGSVAGLVDLDGTFEVRAVFDHDAGGGQIAHDRAVFLNLDAVFGTKISLHAAVDHNFPRDDVGGNFSARANGKFAIF